MTRKITDLADFSNNQWRYYVGEIIEGVTEWTDVATKWVSEEGRKGERKGERL